MPSVSTVSPGVGLGELGSPTFNNVSVANSGLLTMGTGADIVMSTGGDITQTGTGRQYRSSVNALTALVGGAQAGTALTADINRVTTVASAADSVQLPAAVAG